MNDAVRVAFLLRNTPVREILSALERDGFGLRMFTRTGSRIYRHADGRRAVIHYHRGRDTLVRKTLREILRGVQWA